MIELVSQDVTGALGRLGKDEAGPAAPPPETWRNATPVSDPRRGYLQQLDDEGLADWAAAQGVQVRLLARPGDYVFPGAPIALVTPAVEGADEAVQDATALGPQRVSAADLEFAMRQLVEVAVRALSPGINDPHTAMSVLERLGGALCEIAPLYLPTGVVLRDSKPVLVVPSVDYEGLTDTMFHMIRQNAAGSAAVLIRMVEVLTAVVSCEHDPARVAALTRHADLVFADAQRTVETPADLADVAKRHRAFEVMRSGGPSACVDDSGS